MLQAHHALRSRNPRLGLETEVVLINSQLRLVVEAERPVVLVVLLLQFQHTLSQLVEGVGGGLVHGVPLREVGLIALVVAEHLPTSSRSHAWILLLLVHRLLVLLLLVLVSLSVLRHERVLHVCLLLSCALRHEDVGWVLRD